jgi:hypothetical protein
MMVSKRILINGLMGLILWALTGHLSAQSLSRKSFLALEESAKRAMLKNSAFVIEDLVNGKPWVNEAGPDIIRVPYARFYEGTYERKMAILSKPEVYKVMPPEWREPKHKIPYQELKNLPAEKRDRLMKDTTRFEIVY